MTEATECGTSLVQWSGDDGPYHLLLTPTKFVQHGYNVWVDSIPAGTNEYSLYIRQPAGLQFILTVWGASGITYAATTDVMTVGASVTDTKSCFMTDAQILSLYSFSFNMTTADGSDYPPQCSNISVSWPTSLESNVTSDVAKRNFIEKSLEDPAVEINIDLEELSASSSEHLGNTTAPPTLFGVIPLGNSFSIPITFPRNSSFASHLPESSLSDSPTTHTSHGTTHLNWTVDMAKGTRFILVAGIGSAEQWASGGSSRMFTVGQGTTGCVGSESDGNGAPSVTASPSTATATTTVPVPTDSESNPNPVVRTIVAVVCSVLGTLVLVGLMFICRRARNRRRARGAAVTVGTSATAGAGGGGWGMFTKRGGSPKAVNRHSASETQLDLIASRDSHRDPSQDNVSRRDQQRERDTALLFMNNMHNLSVSPVTDSPVESMDPFRDRDPVKLGYTYPYLSGNQTQSAGRSDSSFAGSGSGTAFGGVQSSATTVTDRRGGMREDSFGSLGMGRQSSLDALLSRPSREYYDVPPFPTGASVSAYDHTSNPTHTTTTTNASYYLPRSRPAGPLVLHDPTSRDVDLSTDGGDGDIEEGARESGQDEEERVSENVADLKRETLAISSQARSSPNSSLASPTSTTMTRSFPPGAPGPGRRRRTQPREQEMEYMVHQDAGRVPVARMTGAGVLELPPRYEEVNWSEEERREREEREREREQEGSDREER
ncbi:hypothetical protein CNBG_1231 [Cryptococcus deuterogattii R265]|nr:hypothetical protein CNBG_1231 [Cryptococcus deuterogattii R265]